MDGKPLIQLLGSVANSKKARSNGTDDLQINKNTLRTYVCNTNNIWTLNNPNQLATLTLLQGKLDLTFAYKGHGKAFC